MEYSIEVLTNPKNSDRDRILEPPLEYNDQAAPPSGFETFAIVIRDNQTSEQVGGLWAKINYDWLIVELIFIPEKLRGRDLGSLLLAKAEEIAIGKNCVGIWLDTHSFQAPDFYIKRGFEIFGQLEDHPRGSSRFFLRRVLNGSVPKMPNS